MMATSVMVLRFKDPRPREWRVPLNLRVGKYEFPVGVLLIAAVLFCTAVMNLFTKKVATISGLAFSGFLFLVFAVSERVTARRRLAAAAGMEQFNVTAADQVSCDLVRCRPGNILVAARDHNALDQVAYVLERTDTDERDVVVMTTRLIQGADFSERTGGNHHTFSEYEQLMLSRVVSLAEKMGKPVSLAVVPGTVPEEAIMLTAQRLHSATVVVGRSRDVPAQEKALRLGLAWEKLPHPRPRLTLQVVSPSGEATSFLLGPHPPALRAEDVELLHRIWLELVANPGLHGLHHNQIISVALRRFAAELRVHDRDSILAELRHLVTGEPGHHR